MSLLSRTLHWLQAKDFLDLTAYDSVESTDLDAARIKSKRVLKGIYQRKYSSMISAMDRFTEVDDGDVLELGSGGGFLKEVLPAVITSDHKPLAYVGRRIDAQQLPFEDESLRSIFLMHVFHHIPNVRRFLGEAARCLKPGGTIILVEPHDGIIARFFFGHLHPEPFDRTAPTWQLAAQGPASGSNQAMAYLVFKRDLSRFQQEFPELELRWNTADTLLEYLASGGVVYRQLLPGFCFPLLRFLDWLLTPLMPIVGLHQLLVVKKRIGLGKAQGR